MSSVAVPVLSPGLASLRGYSAPQYPQSSSSLAETLKAPLRGLSVRVKPYLPAEEYGEDAVVVPEWVEPAVTRLAELFALQPDWDSYGGLPPGLDSVNTAFGVLNEVMSEEAERPWIVPLSSGGLQLEWHRPSGDIEIAIDGDDSAICIDDREISVDSGEWPDVIAEVRNLIVGD